MSVRSSFAQLDRQAISRHPADRPPHERAEPDRGAAEPQLRSPPGRGGSGAIMASDSAAVETDTIPDAAMLLRTRPDFVHAEVLETLAARGMSYLRAGYPLHLRGPAGCGKTTLALHLAERLGRPVLLMVGDDSVDAGRLVGGEPGALRTRRGERGFAGLGKADGDGTPMPASRALTLACTEGGTLVYDSFDRSPPSANTALLTVLEERVLVLPKVGRSEGYLRVHPDFRAIFTSEAVETTPAQQGQDALLDRMITLDMDGFDRDTEVSIAAARSGLAVTDTARIVDIVRDFRQSGEYARRPTMRASIMIATLAAQQSMRITADNPAFVQLCLDLLASRVKPGPDLMPDPRHQQMLVKLIQHFCPASRGQRAYVP